MLLMDAGSLDQVPSTSGLDSPFSQTVSNLVSSFWPLLPPDSPSLIPGHQPELLVHAKRTKPNNDFISYFNIKVFVSWMIGRMRDLEAWRRGERRGRVTGRRRGKEWRKEEGRGKNWRIRQSSD